MIVYEIDFTDHAQIEVEKLKKSEKQAYNKLVKLLLEIKKHPYKGTGKPKRLKGNLSGAYSRRITRKHRLVYEIHEDVITVLILSVEGHYDDK
jgi:toxin YoeB